MVLGGLGGFRKVREVNWKNFLVFSSRSDLMVLSYDRGDINWKPRKAKQDLRKSINQNHSGLVLPNHRSPSFGMVELKRLRNKLTDRCCRPLRRVVLETGSSPN